LLLLFLWGPLHEEARRAREREEQSMIVLIWALEEEGEEELFAFFLTSTSTSKKPKKLKTASALLLLLLFVFLAASSSSNGGGFVRTQSSNNDDLSDTPEPEEDKGNKAATVSPLPSSSNEPDDAEEGVPAGDMAASALSGLNGTASSSEVRLEFEVEAPLRPTLPPQAGKKTKRKNATEGNNSESETDDGDDDGSDGSPRYAPALGAALARFTDLPRDRVTIGLAKGLNNSTNNNNNSTGKCGLRSRSKRAKRERKEGACSSFEGTLKLNDGEEADNIRQAFAGGDVTGFVDALRAATNPPGLILSSTNSSVASVASVSAEASASASASMGSPILVEPTPYSVVFTAIDGTPLSASTAGREVVTDGSGSGKKPLGGGAIAGIVIGSVFGVLGALVLALVGVAAVRRAREKRAFAEKRSGGGGVRV
jgi:hypothetical protein